jgi:hypothetical protein
VSSPEPKLLTNRLDTDQRTQRSALSNSLRDFSRGNMNIVSLSGIRASEYSRHFPVGRGNEEPAGYDRSRRCWSAASLPTRSSAGRLQIASSGDETRRYTRFIARRTRTESGCGGDEPSDSGPFDPLLAISSINVLGRFSTGSKTRNSSTSSSTSYAPRAA